MADSFKGELRDQAAHMVAAGFIIAPVLAFPSIPTAMWAGFWIGAVREVTELKRPFTMAKLRYAVEQSKLDLTFWTFGAAITALFLGV